MTKDEIIQKRDQYIAHCIKRCRDADINIGANRLHKIRIACIKRVLWEERLTWKQGINLLDFFSPDLMERIRNVI
jgi:hypothetical protein